MMGAPTQKILAVLGPTNTGKTYYAMQRLLSQSSGIIGFPLRLLARENYDRALLVKGKESVALVTGEEKIIPKHAKYFFCTVEAMPLERSVDLVAVDEIQMCADPDRGHIFTNRLLFARGKIETIFMGAQTMQALIQRLVPNVEFKSHPRLSKLTYVGSAKINRLKPRSAIVTFTVREVYIIAELVRRHRGGAAVVMGSLSPKTRNSQIEMYQQGEVDYLVATDAIGMGLNMEIDHVTFASTHKFDGRRLRQLTAPELAQIAGRAGRYENDGTFGVTVDAPHLDEEVVSRIENHEFDAHRQIFWRNSKLITTTFRSLVNSLRLPSGTQGLLRISDAPDERALIELSKDPVLIDLINSNHYMKVLWEVCQIPDFEKEWTVGHSRLLSQVFQYLIKADGCLPEDWVAEHVKRADNIEGDIDSLSARIGGIRTWTFISHKNHWLADPFYWQARTREIEDRLSDALHEKLIKRFVDKRASILINRLQNNRKGLDASITNSGHLFVEGQFIGYICGLRFMPDDTQFASDKKMLTATAKKVLRRELKLKISKLSERLDDVLDWRSDGNIEWENFVVAKLKRGTLMIHPEISLIRNDFLDSEDHRRLWHLLDKWVRSKICDGLSSLIACENIDACASVRAILYCLGKGCGIVARSEVSQQVAKLSRADRKILNKLGIRLGRNSIYMPISLKPIAMSIRAKLWRIWFDGLDIVPTPKAGIVTFELNASIDIDVQKRFLMFLGYHIFKEKSNFIAVRVDMSERIANYAWMVGRSKPFLIDATLMSFAGAQINRVEAILYGLGFKSHDRDGERFFQPSEYRKRNNPVPVVDTIPTLPLDFIYGSHKKRDVLKGRSSSEVDDSPFSVLKCLKD